VGADDSDDKGVEMPDQFARSRLIAQPDTIKTANQVKRLVVRHAGMEKGSSTWGETPAAPAQLQGTRKIPGISARDALDASIYIDDICKLRFAHSLPGDLDIRGGRPANVREIKMIRHLQALRLTNAHDR
jgi:hypothetical protein